MRFSTDDDSTGARRIHMRPGPVAIGSVLLGLMAICAPAHAQELAGTQPTQLAGDSVEAPEAERPRYDFFSRSQIDWVDVYSSAAVSPLAGPDLSTQQPAAPPPPPEHTGFKAIVVETGRDFKAFPRRTSTWVILGIGGGAAAIAHPFDDRVTERLAGSNAAGRFFVAGKWIGSTYVQVGTAVGLYLVGRYVLPHADGGPKSNKVSHLGFDLLRALIVSEAFTQGIKIAVQRKRPTGECCSFPSGHSSATFATASVLERHLGYRGAWPTFAIAAYVATSRLHDNRHFLSDVLFGGSLGIASGWTIVGRHGRSNYAMMPVPVRGGFMVSFSRRDPAASRP
jgi:membrane-associated phospholipid phosphatase